MILPKLPKLQATAWGALDETGISTFGSSYFKPDGHGGRQSPSVPARYQEGSQDYAEWVSTMDRPSSKPPLCRETEG